MYEFLLIFLSVTDESVRHPITTGRPLDFNSSPWIVRVDDRHRVTAGFNKGGGVTHQPKAPW